MSSTFSQTMSRIAAKSGGKLALGSMALKAGTGYMSYQSSRNEGKSPVESAVSAAGSAFLISKAGPANLAIAKTLASVPSVAANAYYGIDQRRRQMGRMSHSMPFETATFVDTQQAYTMRQAGMKMAQRSQYNVQQAMLGNEAQYMG